MTEQPAERIVTLVPNATEIVAALGLGERLVGRSHECDHPPWVSRLPAVTRASIDSTQSSATIDRQVRGRLEQALSLYEVDAEALGRLRPDLVVTQDQCEVCAVGLDTVRAALAEMTGGDPGLASLKAMTLSEVWADVARIGAAAGVPEAGRRLAADLDGRVAELRRRAEGLARPRVAAIEWLDPPMAAGNWVPELIDAAGGTDIFGRAGAHAPWLAWDDLRAADPDVLVLLPCGFDIARTRAELPALARQPGWDSLRAVREGRVAITDANAYFNRPGPRLADSVAILAEILHPDHFAPRHRGTGWVPLDAGSATAEPIKT